MQIEGIRIKKEANIGDLIITDKGNKYMLLIHDKISKDYPIAIYNVEKDCIEASTMQKVFVVGGTCLNDTIIEIIPSSKIKLIIERK